MRAGGRKITKKPKQKIKKGKMPPLSKYKMDIRLKKDKGKKTKALKEPKEKRRPAALEREIKRDIEELQQILESERKIKKKNRKINLDNN